MSFFVSSIRPVDFPHARRRTVLGIVASVLVHVALLLFVRAKLAEVPPPERSGRPDAPMQVTLIQPQPAPVAQPEPPKPAPEPPRKVEKPAPRKPAAKPAVPHRPAPSVRRPAATRQPVQEAPSTRASVTPAAPQEDFMTAMNRNRERREAAEADAARENAAARAAENPSANDIARANIAFQQRRGGEGGIISILSVGARTGQYVFRGWPGSRRFGQKQTIEVDAGLGGDVRMAIVNSVMGLIYKDFTADFVFISERLGRSVTLSARKSDEAELRRFLYAEFFSN